MLARTITLCAALSGCASLIGIEDTEISGDGDGDAGVDPDAPIAPLELFVDVNTGSDANSGASETEALATITRAVELASVRTRPQAVIRVAAGTYDEATGEVFPILLDTPEAAGVEVVGDEPGRGLGRGVSSGDDGFHVGAGAAVRGLTVVATFSAVVLQAGGTVTSCTLGGDAVGVLVNGDNVTVAGNVARDTVAGLQVNSDAPNAIVSGNSFDNNQVGVAAAEDINLDGATPNNLSCNSSADVQAQIGAQVNADNNLWDHLPPTSGNFGGGIDTTEQGGANITALGAMLSPDPCP